MGIAWDGIKCLDRVKWRTVEAKLQYAEKWSTVRDFRRRGYRRLRSGPCPGCQPTGQSCMQVRGRKNDCSDVLQPPHARAQDFRGSGSVRRSLAIGEQACFLTSSLYHSQVHAAHAKQMDADRQQTNRRVGHPLSRRTIRFCANGDEGFKAPVSAGKLHNLVRSSSHQLHHEIGLGNDSRVH